MDIAIMVEGQNGLNWSRWMNLAAAVEDLGFYGLFRSDHFTNLAPPEKDSLELWVSLTWLASHTHRIQFGPLVTPLSYRNPVLTARMASAIDDLSGERLVLGLGAGWQEREHKMFGFDLLRIEERFDRFEEGLQVIGLLFDQDSPVDFNGKYFKLSRATMLPRPQRPGGPPILIGGNGLKRSLPLAARYADEWNAIFLGKEGFHQLNSKLDEKLDMIGRAPTQIKRSMMTGIQFGRTPNQLLAVLEKSNQTKESLRKKGFLVGTGEEIKSQLIELEKAGLERIMLQWLELDDLSSLSELAKWIL